MQPGLFFFLLYHTNKAVKDFNVLLTLAVYDGAFSDFDVVNQFLNNFPVKLLHIQIAADDTGPLRLPNLSAVRQRKVLQAVVSLTSSCHLFITTRCG